MESHLQLVQPLQELVALVALETSSSFLAMRDAFLNISENFESIFLHGFKDTHRLEKPFNKLFAFLGGKNIPLQLFNKLVNNTYTIFRIFYISN